MRSRPAQSGEVGSPFGHWRVGPVLRGASASFGPRCLRSPETSWARPTKRWPEPDRSTSSAIVSSSGCSSAAAPRFSLHGHEVLIGLLSGKATSNLTGLSVALRALVAARQQGLDDAEIIARSPVVLALTGPRIDGVALPEGAPALPPPLPAEATGDEASILREALRIRIRWVQELTARAARELGIRLHDRGLLPDPLAVMDLGFDDVAALGTGAAVVRRDASPEGVPIDRNGARLPARFQFDAAGRVVAATEPGGGHGVGAGGGVGSGRVTLDPDTAAPGRVLVVADLRPSLAPVIGQLAGLVAESGSPLAHVAILAREASVPTVVGLTAATTTLREGQLVEVDGDAGVVRRCPKGSEPDHDEPKAEQS